MRVKFLLDLFLHSLWSAIQIEIKLDEFYGSRGFFDAHIRQNQLQAVKTSSGRLKESKRGLQIVALLHILRPF